MMNNTDGQEPAKKKSIRDIPIPENRRRSARRTTGGVRQAPAPSLAPEATPEAPQQAAPAAPRSAAAHTSTQPTQTRPPARQKQTVSFDDTNRGSGAKKKLMWSIGIIVVVLVIIFVLSFGGAHVSITQKQVFADINTEVIGANVAAGDEVTGDVSFAVTELVAEASQEVTATGEEEVVQKASGNITIFNEYTEEDQRLVKDTRFESPDGYIYRIPESVVVPGLTRDSSGNVVPGSVTVEVFADEAGDEYNTGAVRYTIPGFEGLPQFDGFYAEGSGSITGGFDGVKKIVSDSDRNQAERALREEIREALVAQAGAQSTDELRMFTDESLTLYELLDEDVSGDTVTITMRGTAKGVVISVEELAAAVASQKVSGYEDGDSVVISNLDELEFRVYTTEATSAERINTVRMSLEGEAVFTWQIDTEAVKELLAGVGDDEWQTVLADVPGVSRGEANIKPFWKNAFPETSDDIDVTVVEPHRE